MKYFTNVLRVLVQREMDKPLSRLRDKTCLRQGVFEGIRDSKIPSEKGGWMASPPRRYFVVPAGYPWQVALQQSPRPFHRPTALS